MKLGKEGEMSDLLIDIRDCQNLNMVASSLVDGSNWKLLLNPLVDSFIGKPVTSVMVVPLVKPALRHEGIERLISRRLDFNLILLSVRVSRVLAFEKDLA